MTVKIKGIDIEMDGITRVVPPLNLESLELLQDRISAFNGNVVDKNSIQLIKDVALASLKRNYPDMTMEEVTRGLDVANMGPIFKAVMDVSGLIRQDIEDQKKLMAAAALANPSIGVESSGTSSPAPAGDTSK